MQNREAPDFWGIHKNKNCGFPLRTKRAFKMKQKVFFITFRGLSWKQIKQAFSEGESLGVSRCNVQIYNFKINLTYFTLIK